jgi:FkbH-like protein
LRLLIAADTVVQPVVRFLDATAKPPTTTVAPLDQVRHILSQLARSEATTDALLVWTTPERALPAFRALLEYQPVDTAVLLSEVDAYANAVIAAAEKVAGVLVLSWATAPHRRWVQALTMRHESGLSNQLMRMNLRLAERFAAHGNIVLLDVQHWYASLRGPAHDPKMWALAKVEYSREFFQKAAAEIASALRALRSAGRKLVICDLDNTLWGGIIGDDGMENIRLGGHDGEGESFRAVQQELLALRKRGILLALCSKNDPAIAWEMIEQHPEMILRRADFAASRISWDDKATAVAALLQELNLLPSAAVFLDDQPAERARIRQAFPDILTPDLPPDVAAYPSFLAALDCFETVSLTAEDRKRTELYQREAERRAAATDVAGIDDWLRSLQIQVSVARLNRVSLVRAAQLLNKTNQFNMAVRRLEQEEFWRWCSEPHRAALCFSVADRFGDSGMVGLVTLERTAEAEATLCDFVMSCRAMGKQIEEAMLFVAQQVAGQLNPPHTHATCRLRAVCHATERNEPFRRFIASKWASAGLLDATRIVRPAHLQLIDPDSP